MNCVVYSTQIYVYFFNEVPKEELKRLVCSYDFIDSHVHTDDSPVHTDDDYFGVLITIQCLNNREVVEKCLSEIKKMKDYAGYGFGKEFSLDISIYNDIRSYTYLVPDSYNLDINGKKEDI